MLTNSGQRHAAFRAGMTAYLFQHLLFAMFEPTRSDNDIKTEIFGIAIFSSSLAVFPIERTSEPWIQIAFITKSSPEERTNALDVTIEVPISWTPFGIRNPQ